jgi:hypothetical protein
VRQASEVERQREVVDSGALPHELEIRDENQAIAEEEDVVVPEVAVHQLPWNLREKRLLGLGDQARELLGSLCELPFLSGRIPASDAPSAAQGPVGGVAWLDLIREHRGSPVRADLDVSQGRMDASERW